MRRGEEGTPVDRSQRRQTGHATARKGYRACAADGEDLFLWSQTREDLSLVGLICPVSKRNYWVQTNQQTNQTSKSYLGVTIAKLPESHGREKAWEETGSWWETSQAEKSVHGTLIRSHASKQEQSRKKVLKDGEHLGILGPAELSFANEGGWWLVRLCLYLGRVYMGHLCTLGSVPL